MDQTVAPLTGRVRELERIAAAARRARVGYPSTVVLTGDAGMGKSALLQAALGGLKDFVLLQGRGSPSSAPERYELAKDLLSTPKGKPLALGSVTGATAQLLDLVGEAQRQGPVVLTVDELERADRESSEALALLVRRLRPGDKVVVLVASRATSAHVEATWQRLERDCPDVEHLSVRGLDSAAVAQLARRHGVRLDVWEAQRLRDHTGGSPLHLMALLREVPTQAWRTLRDYPAPRDHAQLVAERFGCLSKTASDVTSALAVLSRPTSLPELRAMVETGSLDSGLHEAAEADLLKFDARFDPPRAEIHHPLIAAAIRETLTVEHRRSLHLRAAELSVGGSAVEHRVSAAEGLDTALADELVELADDAHGRGEHRLSARYFAWAQQLSPQAEDRERRFLSSCYEHLLDDDVASVIEENDAVQGCAESCERDLVLGMLATRQGQTSEAMQLLRPALAIAQRTGPPRLVARLSAALAEAYHYCDWPGDDAFAAAQAVTGQFVDPVITAELHALRYAHIGASRGVDAALQQISDSNMPDDATLVPLAETDALIIRGLFHYKAGDLEMATTDLGTASRRVRAGSSATVAALGECTAAVAHWFTGAWDQAEVHAELATDIAREVDLPLAHAVAALTPTSRGDMDAADRHLAAAAARSRPGLAPNEILIHAVVGGAYMHATGFKEWPGVFLEPSIVDEAVERALRWKADTSLIFLALGMVMQQSPAKAGAVLDVLPRRRAAPAWVHMARGWVQGLLVETCGDPDGALRTWKRTTEAYGEEKAAPLLQAHLHHDLGRSLMTRGEERQGGQALRRAFDAYRDLGATVFARKAEAALRGVPGTGSGASTAMSALTSREREIARLVGRGLTNREIGSSLYVTERTVAFHLTNIFNKLGVRGRRELRDLVQSV
ncbi:AAA family ATPase [Streptomyces sp. NPDC048479]|uniref:helix-turn-helix transcriptional regulator n=1 Tax=Streptomyces sp. NPDC048479 TaxID=3154725 RepID=UPI0034249930